MKPKLKCMTDPRATSSKTISARSHKDYRPSYFRSGPYVAFSGENKVVSKSAVAVGTYLWQSVLTS